MELQGSWDIDHQCRALERHFVERARDRRAELRGRVRGVPRGALRRSGARPGAVALERSDLDQRAGPRLPVHLGAGRVRGPAGRGRPIPPGRFGDVAERGVLGRRVLGDGGCRREQLGGDGRHLARQAGHRRELHGVRSHAAVGGCLLGRLTVAAHGDAGGRRLQAQRAGRRAVRERLFQASGRHRGVLDRALDGDRLGRAGIRLEQFPVRDPRWLSLPRGTRFGARTSEPQPLPRAALGGAGRTATEGGRHRRGAHRGPQPRARLRRAGVLGAAGDARPAHGARRGGPAGGDAGGRPDRRWRAPGALGITRAAGRVLREPRAGGRRPSRGAHGAGGVGLVPPRLAHSAVIAALLTASLTTPAAPQAPEPSTPLDELDATHDFPPLWSAPDAHPRARQLAIAARKPSAYSLPEDAAWEGFVTPESRGTSALFIEYQGKLVLQNSGIAGSLVSPYLSTWDGSKFEPLPPLGFNPTALGVWNDQLIVGTGSRILKLDGAAWDTLGTANSSVWALEVYQGHLIAGGSFTSVSGVAAPLVAAFDGSTWSNAGTGLAGTQVTGLTVHAGSLVAGGAFYADSGNVVSIGSLGGVWQVVGAGFTGWPEDVLSDGVHLYASGLLGSSGGVTMGGLARWDGAVWTSTGAPFGKHDARMTRWNGKIVTTFRPPSASEGLLAQWDGVSLSSVPGDSLSFGDFGVADRVGTWGTNLVVTGNFVTNGSTLVPGIAVFDGAEWSTIGLPWSPGMTGPTMNTVNDMRAWGGKLMVSGPFPIVADQDHWIKIRGIAAWDGAHWSPLGARVGGAFIRLGEYAGDLIAGGHNFRVDGTSITNVGRWNGTSWSALGTGAPNDAFAFAEFQEELYVASVSGLPLSRWNGATWTSVPGLDYVYALAVSEGRLVVGGQFPQAGSATSPNVVFWDGANWVTAGAGVNGSVLAAATWLGKPVIGGWFSASGLTPLPGVAYWDGSQWLPMGTRAVAVYELKVLDGELFASGYFKLPDDTEVFSIARWTGTDWDVLGSGSNNYPFAIHGGYLYHAGHGLVHGHPSHNLSRVPLSAVLDTPRPRVGGPGVALTVARNPARGFAELVFSVPLATRARLTVHDVAGRQVATLADGPIDAGEHRVRWVSPARPGVYFASLELAGGARHVARVVRVE